MRWMLPIFLFVSVAVGQTDERREKIQAASNQAVILLYQDVAAQPLTVGYRVGDFVERTESREKVLATLREAEQIGGPRWINEQTCQVRLEIPGNKVGAKLLQIATEAAERSPVRVEALRNATAAWERRTFSAVGTAGPAVAPATQPAPFVLPAAPPRWAGDRLSAEGRSTPAATKLRAARAAELQALDRLRAQVAGLPVGENRTVADLTRQTPALNSAIDRVVMRAKLTRVDYHADHSATVQATLDLSELWREIDLAR